MAHWDEVAVTAAGEAMLNDLLAGRRLTVLSAWGGSGETDPAELAALIDVAGERHRLEILDVENGLEGKTVKVQISNSGVETGFTLHQIGVFAQVDQGPERLLCVYQDRDQRGRPGGVEVPAQAECPAFLLEFYGFLKITGGVRFEVDLSQSGAVVTPQYLTQVMEGHDQGGRAHPAIWEALEQVRETADAAAQAKPETGSGPPGEDMPALPGRHYFDEDAGEEYVCLGERDGRARWVLAGAGAISAHNGDPAALDARLSLLELMFNTDVTGNPFTVTFESLTGMVASGVWNQAQRRLEF